MKSEAINRKITLTASERDEIVKSLVDKGVDASLVHSALSVVAHDCNGYGPYGCPKFIVGKVNPDALGKLKREIDAKGIKMPNVNPAVAKLFK